ncbi:MAG: hypothetical protein ACE5OZ_08325 [Candidatus Heimdallarchaeota archaeon]
MTVLRGETTQTFFQESDSQTVRLEAKGNGVDVGVLEIWHISDESIVTIAGKERAINPPKERINPIQSADQEWYYLSRGKYEAVLPKIIIPADVVVLAFPRSSFNRLFGFHMLPSAVWDSGFSARGTLSFEVKVKELRFLVQEPLFQLIAVQAERVSEESLYQGYWQEKE